MNTTKEKTLEQVTEEFIHDFFARSKNPEKQDVIADATSSHLKHLKEIGIPEKTAVALLLDHRYLYRSPSGWLMPFADKSARGYFIVRDCYGRSGKLVQQTRVTCKGKNHLFKLFKKWGVIE